jgi:tetratricopeptide (TPR) repeat protein
VISDKEYAADYSMGKRLRKRRVYLSSMSEREAEGFVYFLRGQRLEDHGQAEKAVADLEMARKLYPQSTQARSELAWLYATAPGVDAARRAEAIALAKSALDLEPECATFWDASAAAHAANGDFTRAAKEARKAEDLAETPEDRAQFKDHRKSFEAREIPGTAGHPH